MLLPHIGTVNSFPIDDENAELFDWLEIGSKEIAVLNILLDILLEDESNDEDNEYCVEFIAAAIVDSNKISKMNCRVLAIKDLFIF